LASVEIKHSNITLLFSSLVSTCQATHGHQWTCSAQSRPQ